MTDIDDQPRRGGVAPLGRAISQFLATSGLGAKMRDLKVHEAWRDALGPELAPRATSVDFRRGELIVEVDSAAHKHELVSFTGEQYRQEANRRIGDNRIRRVSFKLRT
ncbi:MAG: DUF721 domain-containing protein [Planctomycetota bacterium]|jgi:hypothetical protein|nr:DUF721 domain-containing protein [Planctomycetota bacterium]